MSIGDCMSKIDSNDLIDIFKEEVTKKNKKELKKQKKLEKKLEKKENIEFEKLAKKAKEKEEKKKVEKSQSKKEKTIEKVDERNESVFAFLYDTVFGFFLTLLLFCSIGFISITLYNDNSIKNIIQMTSLGVFVVFYIISMTTKKEGIKKIAAIIANSAICLAMAYSLYIA